MGYFMGRSLFVSYMFILWTAMSHCEMIKFCVFMAVENDRQMKFGSRKTPAYTIVTSISLCVNNSRVGGRDRWTLCLFYTQYTPSASPPLRSLAAALVPHRRGTQSRNRP